MDCRAIRKFLGAFADGELEVRQNLEVLEHLKMCPNCAARVTDITDLKAALARAYAEERAPAHLHDRIRSALEAETRAPYFPRHPVGAGFAAVLRRRWMVPLGMAASLLLAAFLWRIIPVRQARSGEAARVPGRVVSDVREQHRLCTSQRGDTHHDPSLPRDLQGIAKRLSAELKMAVIAPDLKPQGFALVGADRCGIGGRPGAHVLYRSVSIPRLMLSVFTVGRLASLGSRIVDQAEGREYLVASDGSLCVVAWHRGAQTYFVCAPLPEGALLDLVSRARVAGIIPPERSTPILGAFVRY